MGEIIRNERPYHHFALCSPEDSILEVLHSVKFGYYITGTQMGYLTVWKLAFKNTKIHEFSKNVRAISSIIQDPNN